MTIKRIIDNFAITGALVCGGLLTAGPVSAAVEWYDGRHHVEYNVVGQTSPVVDIALQMFSSDMKAVTGKAARRHKKASIEIYQLDKANAKAIRTLSRMNV
ncbi:MAG: hypothetical protein Q4D28_09800, partial [Prevotellaceae bacterium]|nr:hypothetical protein [Prevotellaceae bacterium]